MFNHVFQNLIKNPKDVQLKRGEILYHGGDQPKNLFCIQSGLVGLFHISNSGKETFFRVFGKGYILGHRSHLAGENYHASAIALTQTSLISTTTQEYDEILANNLELNKELLKILARDLGKAELRFAGLQDKPANQRIAESLVYLKLRYPNHTWTRKEIGEYSGSTYETVTRVMTKLESQDIIKKQGRDFEILDLEMLLSFEDQA